MSAAAFRIQTFSGRMVDPFDLRPDEIQIIDVAVALAHQCRFGGHPNQFYSVAEHSVRVSRLCPPTERLWGLLHDASEAYLVDVPRPIKHRPEMQPYRDAERRVMAAVCERFGLDPEQPDSVTDADDLLLATEARDLMAPLHPNFPPMPVPLEERIRPWSIHRATIEFLHTFNELGGVW